MWQATGVKPEELNTGELDPEFEYLVPLFNELYPFSYESAVAYCKVTGYTLRRWEIQVINRLGSIVSGKR